MSACREVDQTSRCYHNGCRREARGTAAIAALKSLKRYFLVLPPVGKAKSPLGQRAFVKLCLRKSGAGEGIRTLDPDLGKVVLYP